MASRPRRPPCRGPPRACERWGARGPLSDVEEADVLGVAGDEAAAGLDVLTHQHAEDVVGRGGVLEGDLPEDARLRVHRGLPQLAEPLDPLEHLVLDLATTPDAGLDARVALLVAVGVLVADLAAPLDLVQR